MPLDHARVVLSGIVPNRRDNLLYALQHLEPDHFRGTVERNIFIMLDRYFNVANDILPSKVLTDILERQGADVSTTLLYQETFGTFVSASVPDHEFRYAIDALKDMRAQQLTGEAITKSMEILDRGVEIDRVDYKGHSDARQFLYGQLSHIDQLGNAESVPEGDIRLETKEMAQDYADIVANIHKYGVNTGIKYFDKVTSGVSNGELVLICAYTAEGKSQLATQTAWEAVTQGKNVFFATSETVRRQVMRRIIARHTRLPMFDCPGGINTKDLKNGTLSADHLAVYEAALDDWKVNPAYGKSYLAQVPRGATLSYIDARLNRQAASWDVDLVVIDYLALLKPETRHNSEREGFNEILRDAKVMATSHAGGRGVPILSPWAMRQSEWKEATAHNGIYSLANLADTSEAEKSADIIWSLLRIPGTNELIVQFLKNRDGEEPPAGRLMYDYRNAFLTDADTGSNPHDFHGVMSGV